MRIPSDMPRPGGRRPRRRPGPPGRRGRVALAVAAVVLLVLVTSLRGIAGFYTDYLWFDSLGRGGVFTGILQAKVTLVVLFTAGFFVLLWVNLLVADRLAPAFRPIGPEDEIVARYRALVGTRTGLVRAGAALGFALIAGSPTSSQWREWILFNNAVDFGVTEPLFDQDVGFYVFRLPFLTFLVGWLFAALVIVFIVTSVAHYLNGGIRLQVPAAQRVTPQVKAHLSVLLAMLALVKAADYWLQRYELTVSTRGTVDGALYTDVNAQLPATYLLALILVAAALLFLYNIRRRGWVFPVLGIGIWLIVAIVAGGIVPAAVQRFRVEPSESSTERPYLVRNIEATRAAMGLAEVDDQTFTVSADLTAADLAGENAAILDNIRLWDPVADGALATFRSLQSLRPFYAIRDVDVDRYELDGDVTQVVIAARELNTEGVTQASWEARHLTFTHGYGYVVAPTNEHERDGRPSFLVGDIPIDPDEVPPELAADEPGIYFGEGLGGYVITNTNRLETDFQNEEGEQEQTTYAGQDGVGIGNFMRRAAFALRFGDLNPLFSGNLRADSRVLYHRDIHDRVRQLAPFLDFDRDPYPVIVDGRILWVIDAYTTTDRYPYAQRAITDGLEGADLDQRFNYIRNSVKAVVDAYDGTVTFYVVDEGDPIIRAYRQAFPELFTDEAPPAALAAHFRYPEDMFRVQSNMWGRYHLTDPDGFYTQNDAWVVARDPGRTRQATATADRSTTTTTAADAAPRQRDRIDPYYVLTRLPEQEGLGFQIIRPFVPFDPRDERQQLTAYLVAESDGARYGRLTSYRVTGTLPDGPGIVADSINGNVDVSREQSLLCRQGSGSQCTFGNLIVVPIERSLLYVQPLYVRAERPNAPALLQRVIVEFDGEVGIGSTLDEALRDLPSFSDLPQDEEEPPPDDGGEPPAEATIAELLARVDELFQEADAALAAGDLGAYQDAIDEARSIIDEIEAILAEQGAVPPESTTTTTQPESA